MKLKRCVMLGIIIVLMAGCARTFVPIDNQKHMEYYRKFENNGFTGEYSFHVLEYSQNNTYAKKAFKRGFQIISVKLTNETDRVLNLNSDVNFKLNDQPLYPLKADQFSLHIKQLVLPHLLWTGLSAGAFFIDEDIKFLRIPVALIGPLVALNNIVQSNKANEKLVEYVNDNNLLSKTIKPGETLEGVLVVKSFTHGELKIELIK